jgi:hypothetical protein
MHKLREMRWGSAVVLSIALTMSCGSSDKGTGSTPTGGSGDDTGGAGGRNTGGSTTGGTTGTGGSSTGGAMGTSPDAGGSVDTGAASDASGAAVGAERFVGEWDYLNGGAMLTCPGQAPISQTYDSSNYITINAGAGVSPLILALMGCTLRFDVQGQDAVIQPGQMCTFALAGKPATEKPEFYTFAGVGDSLRESSRFTVTFTGNPTPCTLTTQGTLKRHQ